MKKSAKPVLTKAEAIHKAYVAKWGTLKPQERDIIERYYGFGENLKHTLEEIGKIYGLSRERIRQLKHYAVEKIMGE